MNIPKNKEEIAAKRAYIIMQVYNVIALIALISTAVWVEIR